MAATTTNTSWPTITPHTLRCLLLLLLLLLPMQELLLLLLLLLCTQLQFLLLLRRDAVPVLRVLLAKP